MKLKLWNKENVESSENDQLFLRLVNKKEDENDFCLICCDKEGEKIENGILFIIDQELKVVIAVQDISEKVPLKTDLSDTLIIVTEEDIKEKLRRINEERMIHFKLPSNILKIIDEMKKNSDVECSDRKNSSEVH